ncbi:arabinosyltransferase domain-containing protein [Antrihabitans cavernicola]|uniref:arabinosyltransferase domain-containing protein n=1 Tax=Antrihabitans cavernicola TaxID=2495913 RepID=UPI0035300D2F
MVDSDVRTVPPAGKGPTTDPNSQESPSRRRTYRIAAVVTAVLGILLTIATPLLPVDQQQSSITWPQGGSTRAIDVPLVSYSPVTFDATIPCSAVGDLAGANGGILMSTSPQGAPNAEKYGLVAKVTAASSPGGARLEVVQRERTLLAQSVDALPPNCSVVIDSNPTRSSVELTGSGTPATVFEGDLRPQVVGIFSDIKGAPPAGLQVRSELDSRFSSTPTTLKLLAMIIGSIMTVLSFIALHLLDNSDGRRSRRFLPNKWWALGRVDVVVIGTLILWHFIGATTADDGYQYGMAKAAHQSGYMGNYFRYWGVPESPVGTPYYDAFGVLSRITTASPFVRLIALACGIVAWLVISREVVPRLGARIRENRVAIWTGALVFLAFWLPYNNGLRPEPAVALGVLLTWCSVERAIATRRLLPAAIAILIAGFTVTCGPSGIICFAALLAGLRPIVQIWVARGKKLGYLSQLLPVIAAGTVILVPAFADQTLAVVREMNRVHVIAGPSVPWFEEYLRYQYLLNISPDGSLSRRFGVFVMILSLAVCIVVMLRRNGKIPGIASGPARRIIGITIGAMVLMMFTPTKWTHHFGIYAGLAGSLAVVTAVAVSAVALRSRRNRALFAAAILFLLAMCFTSSNGWWYVTSWGVPFWDKPIMIAGLGASTIFLGLTMLMLAVAVWFHLREPYTGGPTFPKSRWWALPPLTIAAAGMVLLEVLSMAKGAVAQYPSFSLAKSNFDALAGNACGLAPYVQLETDPNKSMLQPLTGDASAALAGTSSGFTPDGVAGDLTADEETSAASGTANSVDTGDQKSTTTSSAGTGGGAGQVGINGSNVALPFGLSPQTTPVLGSYQSGEQSAASLTSGWYGLPGASGGARGDLISIAVAGRVRSVDHDGIVTDGPVLQVEYGTKNPDGSVAPKGRVTPIDIGPAPSWRNLRVPMDQIPASSDVVRLVVSDQNANPDQWIAVTPPRVPQTRTLQDVVGTKTPVMVDWAVGLQFPCQRPFDSHEGVAEVPEYRILPDRIGAITTNKWQDHYGGGPLGWIDILLDAKTIPSYLKDDLSRDWGEIERYEPRNSDAVPAQVNKVTVQRSGMWTPGPINTAS